MLTARAAGAGTLTFRARIMEYKEPAKPKAGVLGTVRGMASTTDLNSLNMVVAATAFDASLPKYMDFPQVLFNHDWGKVIGKATAVRNTPDGVELEAEIVDTAAGRDAWLLIGLGGLRAFSVGFNPIDGTFDSKTGVETITEAELQEVSIVGRPANPSATFVALADIQGAKLRTPEGIEQQLQALAVAVGCLGIVHNNRQEQEAVLVAQTKALASLAGFQRALEENPLPTTRSEARALRERRPGGFAGWADSFHDDRIARPS